MSGIVEIFSPTMTIADHQGQPPDQRRRLVPAGAGQRRHRFASAGPGQLHQLDDLPAGHGDHVSRWCRRQRTRLEKLLRRVVCGGRHQAAPQSDLRVGLRDEFTTGWNEESGRAANYITDANGVLMTAPLVGGSASRKITPLTCSGHESAWRGTFSETAKPPFAPASAPIIR